MIYIILLLAVLIAAACLVLAGTRKRLREMDGLGKVSEPGEDEEDVIASFGE